jgi:hypothetical protein
MGDALRGQKKDVSKYTVAINGDGSLTFHSDGYPAMKLKKKSEALLAAPPTGTFEGSVPFIIDLVFTIDSATTVDMDINVKVAHQEIKCKGEAIAISGNTITFPNVGDTGDCMGDALRGQKKDVTKYTVAINADGSLTFHSDSYPAMKLKKKSEALLASPPTGTFEGSVPFIIDLLFTFDSATAVDLDINVKVAHQEIKCKGEAIAIGGSTITFPNIANTGDCMGDALRGQKKDVSKYTVAINGDGSLTFHSDGYPAMKLKKKHAMDPIIV